MDKTRLLAELDELRKLREQVEKSLQNAPSGSIRSEMAQGKYLKKSQIEIARQRLFVTFECSQKAINLKQLDLLIDRMV